jgi:signal transduction histidine kinase
MECWAMVATADANVTINGDLTSKADPSRLKRLSDNLFRNAIEHRVPDVSITVGALNDGRV